MGTVITNLKARFGVDTTDFKKGLKAGEQAMSDFKDGASKSVESFAALFGVNMTSVNTAVETAMKSLKFLRAAFISAAEGSDILVIATKVLKSALISTGVGALVVVLGSLTAFFTKSGRGAEIFGKTLAGLKSVLNNVIERLIIFGEGIVDIFSGRFQQGWQKMKDAFKGIGQEIEFDWHASRELADDEEKLEDREIALITTLEARRAKIAELRLQAKEETEDNKKKLDLLNQAEALTKSVYGDQIAVEKERLRIMQLQMDIKSKDPTDAERRAIAEQEAKINSLLREQANDLRTLQKEKNTVIKAVGEEAELEKKKAESIAASVSAITNLKLPNLSNLSNKLIPITQTIKKSVNEIQLSLTDMAAVVESTMESAIGAFAEYIGEFMTGMATSKDLLKALGNMFGDMLIRLGEIAIATAIGVKVIEKALQSLDWRAALVAGIALIALGAAVKSAVSNLGNNLVTGGAGGASVGGNVVYDTTGMKTTAPVANLSSDIKVTGELVGRGKDLVAVINTENQRLYTNS